MLSHFHKWMAKVFLQDEKGKIKTTSAQKRCSKKQKTKQNRKQAIKEISKCRSSQEGDPEPVCRGESTQLCCGRMFTDHCTLQRSENSKLLMNHWCFLVLGVLLESNQSGWTAVLLPRMWDQNLEFNFLLAISACLLQILQEPIDRDFYQL